MNNLADGDLEDGDLDDGDLEDGAPHLPHSDDGAGSGGSDDSDGPDA